MGCCASTHVRSVDKADVGEEEQVDEDDMSSEAMIKLKAEARNMFAMVDEDGSGTLDRDELRRLVELMGAHHGHSTASRNPRSVTCWLTAGACGDGFRRHASRNQSPFWV